MIGEVPVHHYHRAFRPVPVLQFPPAVQTAIDVMKLWVVLVVRKEHYESAGSWPLPSISRGLGNR